MDTVVLDMQRIRMVLTMFRITQGELARAAVRLRSNAAKRFKKTKSGVYRVFEVLRRLEKNWRRLKSAHMCSTIQGSENKQKTRVA